MPDDIKTLFVIPKDDKCNASCGFCITEYCRGTGNFKNGGQGTIDIKRLEKAVIFAKSIRVADSSINGGVDPTMEKPERLELIAGLLSDNFGRVNMLTNGQRLLNSYRSGDMISYLGGNLTNLTISRAHYDDKKNSKIMGLAKYDLEKTITRLDAENINTKFSCLLLKKYIHNNDGIMGYIDMSRELGVAKVMFRELTPIKGNSAYEKYWNENYVPVKTVSDLMEKMDAPSYSGFWKQKIWEVDGVGVTLLPDGYRNDTRDNGDLIYRPNNCLYSSWDSETSRVM
jgi:molybdenum cofactor biosynthesis enzyme MoaA